MTTLLGVLVGAPALAALLGLPAGRRWRPVAATFGVGGAAAALVVAVLLTAQTFGDAGAHARLGLGVVDLGSVTVDLALRADPVSALLALAVTVVALAVQVYSVGYLVPRPGHDGPLRYPAYAATVSLFTAAMLTVVASDDLFTMVIGWEVMGVCSYLLIGHHSERPAARRAALQAWLVTRVADVGFLLGIVVLFAIGGTTSVPGLLAAAGDLPAAGLTTAGLLLLAGVVGKSAQFPLFGWLPDAMEGPTPVSALIHAATMVAAGVVVLVRLGPLYDRAPVALATLAVISCVTMILAALAAFVSGDLKRVLAWSTVSQIAVMLAAVSLGSAAGRAGALAHLISHSGFKALLFLVAGIIALRMGTTRLEWISDLRRRSPWLTAGLAVGLGALAALPPFTGFVSKEGIFSAALGAVTEQQTSADGWVATTVMACLGVTTLLTGLYSARLYSVLTRRDVDHSVSPEEQARRLQRQGEITRNRDLAERTGRQDTITVMPARPVTPAPQPSVPQPPVEPVEPVEEPGYVADDALDEQSPDPNATRPMPRVDPLPPLSPPPSRRPSDHDQDWGLLTGEHTPHEQHQMIRPDADPESRLARLMRQRLQSNPPQPQPRITFRPGDSGEGDGEGTAQQSEERPAAPEPTAPAGLRPPEPAPIRDKPTSYPLSPRPRRRRQAHVGVHATLPLEVGTAAPKAPLVPPAPPPKPLPGPRSGVTMRVAVAALTVWTLALAALPLLNPASLAGFHLGWLSVLIGLVPALLGTALGFARGLRGSRDVATRIAAPTVSFLSGGYGYHAVQRVLATRPAQALARGTGALDLRGIERLVDLPATAAHTLGRWAGRVQRGQVTGYLSWVGGAAVLIGIVATTWAGIR